MGYKARITLIDSTVYFDNGERMDLHNVKWFDSSGTHLRLMCDEGLVIINPARVLAHISKATTRTDEAFDLKK